MIDRVAVRAGLAARNDVGAEIVLEPDRIRIGAAEDKVGARAALQQVGTGAAGYNVAVSAAKDAIVSALPVQHVGPGAA